MGTEIFEGRLFGKTRTAVLRLLLGQPGQSFYLRQIVRLTGAGVGAVQRELKQLTAAGLLRRTDSGGRTYYQADGTSPALGEFAALFSVMPATPSSSAPEPEAGALAALCRRHHIRRLSLFGSALRGELRPESDIDLLVEFAPGRKPGLLALSAMERELSPLFGGRSIDLRTPEDLSRYIRPHVVNEAEVKYAAGR